MGSPRGSTACSATNAKRAAQLGDNLRFMELYRARRHNQMWSLDANKATLADAASATEMAVLPKRSMILYNRRQLIETTPQACSWFPFDDGGSSHVLAPGTPLVVNLKSTKDVSHELTYNGGTVYKLNFDKIGQPLSRVPIARWAQPPLAKRRKGAVMVTDSVVCNPSYDGFLLGVASGMRGQHAHQLRHVHAVVAGRTFISTASPKTVITRCVPAMSSRNGAKDARIGQERPPHPHQPDAAPADFHVK